MDYTPLFQTAPASLRNDLLYSPDFQQIGNFDLPGKSVMLYLDTLNGTALIAYHNTGDFDTFHILHRDDDTIFSSPYATPQQQRDTLTLFAVVATQNL